MILAWLYQLKYLDGKSMELYTDILSDRSNLFSKTVSMVSKIALQMLDGLRIDTAKAIKHWCHGVPRISRKFNADPTSFALTHHRDIATVQAQD